MALWGLLTLSGRPRADEVQPKNPVAIELDRSPLAIAISPNGRFAATANHTAGSVSLVDLKNGHVIHEHRCGNGPADVVWIDEERLLVSLQHDDDVVLLRLENNRLRTIKTISVGDEPRGIALHLTESSQRAFVALAGIDEVAVIDLQSQQVIKRIPVGGIPRSLAVSPDGRWLITCCNVPGSVSVHDAATYKFVSKRPVFDEGFGLSRPIILPDSSQVVLASPINRTFPVTLNNIEKGWVIDNRLTKLPLPDGKYWQQKQLGLDTRGKAAGDANALAYSPNGKWLVISCGGSHELLVIDNEILKWPVADPGDFVPHELLANESALRHVKLGGRPVDVRFLDETTAVVANYLSNSLQIIDVTAAKVVRTISLGGPKLPSLTRRGEAIFFDADRSFDSWFSCHSCHFEGHTGGQTYDTLNDGNYDTYKLVPTLRGVTKTGPWTWHGWQTSLQASVKKSLQTTLSTQHDVTAEDVDALMAYLTSLKHPPSPHQLPGGHLTKSATRGKLLFTGKAACADCHQGNLKTSADTYTVGLESNRYFYREFNPPSLSGLYTRRRFLHDGRADTLHEVLTRHHQPEKLTGEKLTAEELRDLIAYLKSL
jgi:YVTN family beta-propeller protein